MKQLAVAIILAAFLAIGLVSGILLDRHVISTSGNVQTVGIEVYWEQNCTTEVTQIDWGILEPGSLENVTVYARNEGSLRINLTLTTENWQPIQAPQYLNLTWDYSNQVIEPGRIQKIVLTLSVAEEVPGTGDFSFLIVITGRPL